MKAYSEYKSSSIDWLGTIPQHWDCVKTAWLFDQIGSGTTPTSGEDAFYKDGTVNWLQTGDLNDGIITETSKKVTEYALKIKGLRLYPKGSLVIAMYGATIAKLGLLDIDTTVNQACCVLVKSKKVNSNFIFYFFQVAKKELISLASGGGQPNISQSTIYDFKVPVPPLVEQEAIAAYLDDLTGKVDALITEKQKQVEDLRSYRTSLITETVTRGLNPNAPLRPSGIDWLGDIPEHWETAKLKYVSTVQTGSTPSTSVEKYWDNPIKDWFTPGDFNTFRLSSSNRKVSEVAFNEGACRIFPKNSILLVGIGATLGKVGITTIECSANQQVNTIVFNDKVYPLFGAYYLSSCNDALNSVSNASTLAILNQDQTKQFPMVVPPISEQKSIAEFLDEKTEKIDALIRELEKQLEELAEYKKAVISEAVTGKVDVRDWKPQN